MRAKWPDVTARFSHLRRQLGLILGPRPLTTDAGNSTDKAAADAAARAEAYRKVQKDLDFSTAVEIMQNCPPKRKKFGFDFHLVQFFFACMPSLAVYLVAQYARYEIRRMESEAELKKKLEEEEKAKAAELGPVEEGSEADLSKVIVRLDALEEAVKEIADERKKVTPSKSPNGQEVGKKEQVGPAGNNFDSQSKPEACEVTPDKSSKTVGGSNPTDIAAADRKEQYKKKVENGEPSFIGTKQ